MNDRIIQRQAACRPARASTICRGFTLVELLVVIAIIGILISLLMPAMQMAREAARRSKCLNNIKQLGLAMHNYHAVFNTFPPGGLSTSAGDFGHSWLIRILPYIEEENIYEEIDQTSSVTGRLVPDALPSNKHNRDVLRSQDFPWMFCPSSTLDRLVLTAGQYGADAPNVMSPTYTGISGALDHTTTREKNPLGTPGKISWGGVMIIDGCIGIQQIKDGASHTMMLGEQSGWCTDDNGVRVDCRSDCGYGFPMGTARDINIGWERQFNVACVIHPFGETSYRAYGVPGDCGPNRPIQSAHPGSVQVLMADGSGQTFSNTMNLQTVYNLANRDDGKRINLDSD
jgi:prepilin-type N-terminal cleavage/methylation domain-containing protein